MRGQAFAHLDRRREAVDAVQRALATAGDNPQASYEAALVYALIGDDTSALVNAEKALDRGVEARWFSLSWFDRLRASPELAGRLGGSEEGSGAGSGAE